MKFAVLLAVVAFVAVTAAEEFKCQDGASYIENECNTCSCTPTGLLYCTYKACLGPKDAELRHCEVGTTSEKDCNKCWCTKEYGTVCTNNKC